jgi:Xaa-Pro aminopeptidase
MSAEAHSRTVLIYADSKTSPEMRREVPVAVPDPFLYVEHDGRRRAVVVGFEVPRLREHGIEATSNEDYGLDDLLNSGHSRSEARLEVVARACQSFGITSALVPATFPLEVAERLRHEGIEVICNRDFFEERRRCKTLAQVEGIKRAQRAAEAGMAAAASLMRKAIDRQGLLNVGGQPLTSERLREAITRAYRELGALPEDVIVAHGYQIYGHDPGSGPIASGEPVVIDLAPRDPETGCFADMTRTFVTGKVSEEILTYHRYVGEALNRAKRAVRPGVKARFVYDLVCDYFEDLGYETERSKVPGTVVTSGFFHGLGHGVGLEIHERPFLARSSDVLVEGDVVTLEPGLYRQGYGGCRLEDLVRVGKNGAEVLTDFPYDLVP